MRATKKSAELVRSIVDTDIVTTTDVAFSLPVGYCDVQEHNRPKFGLNVSGLLWTIWYHRFLLIDILEKKDADNNNNTWNTYTYNWWK